MRKPWCEMPPRQWRSIGTVKANGMLHPGPPGPFPFALHRTACLLLLFTLCFLFLISLFSSVGFFLPNLSVQDVLFWGKEHFDGVAYVVVMVLIEYCVVYSPCDDWWHCIRHSMNTVGIWRWQNWQTLAFWRWNIKSLDYCRKTIQQWDCSLDVQLFQLQRKLQKQGKTLLRGSLIGWSLDQNGCWLRGGPH